MDRTPDPPDVVAGVVQLEAPGAVALRFQVHRQREREASVLIDMADEQISHRAGSGRCMPIRKSTGTATSGLPVGQASRRPVAQERSYLTLREEQLYQERVAHGEDDWGGVGRRRISDFTGSATTRRRQRTPSGLSRVARLLGVAGVLLSASAHATTISNSLGQFINRSMGLFAQNLSFPNIAGEFVERQALGSLQLPVPATSASVTFSFDPEHPELLGA